MPQWVVEYWGRRGRSRMPVRAGSHASARRSSGVPASRVIRISRDWSSLRGLDLVARRPGHKTQLLFLVRAQAMLASTGRVAVVELIDQFGELRRMAKYAPQARREDLNLSRRLEYLGFDNIVVTLIVTGERTGTLKETLRAALRYVKMCEKVRNETSSQVSLGLLLFALGLLSLFVLPLVLSEPLQALQNLRGIEIRTTLATDLLLGLNMLITEQLGVLLVAAAAVCAAAVRWRERLGWLWPISLFEKLRNTKRSVQLLMVWVPFRLTRLALENEEDLLSSMLGKDASSALIPRLRMGAALEDVLDARWFSPTLAFAASSLNAAPRADVQSMSDVVMGALLEEQKGQTRRVSLSLYLGGAILTIGVIVMTAFGLIFPILGATTVGF